DWIRIDTSSGHKIQRYQSGSYQTIYTHPTDFTTVHVRTHDGDDMVVMNTSFDMTLWAFAGKGYDNIYGGVGDDFLSGGYDAFQLGTAGINTIYGGDGEDIINGGDDAIIGYG